MGIGVVGAGCPRAFALALVLLAIDPGLASAASAQTAAPAASGDTRRLTDAEREAILAGNTPESAAAARGELTGAERADRGIHGEVGVMVGSNGTRGIYGVAAIPLGNNGSAVVSFEDSRYGYRSRPARP